VRLGAVATWPRTTRVCGSHKSCLADAATEKNPDQRRCAFRRTSRHGPTSLAHLPRARDVDRRPLVHVPRPARGAEARAPRPLLRRSGGGARVRPRSAPRRAPHGPTGPVRRDDDARVVPPGRSPVPVTTATAASSASRATTRRETLAVPALLAAALAAAASLPPPAADARGLPELACDAELATAASGLQFCESVVGSGKVPAKGAQIKAHYTGRLTDGRVFDSSYSRGSPLSFKVGVGQVIRGWDEGILGGEGIPPMKVGGKRVLVIPANLGYGDRGAGGGLIPGGATLKFDVELVDA
jgi:peptidylprolyl isomerase